jgi:hypothetical protein
MKKVVVEKCKLTPEEVQGTISEEARLIAGRVDNITEFAVGRGNKTLSRILAEGMDVVCKHLDDAAFNLGNGETSDITQATKAILRKEIEQGGRYVLLPTKIVWIRDETGVGRHSVQLPDKMIEDLLVNEELDRVHATEDIIQVSRLLALGCTGLKLPSKQRVSALAQLAIYRNLVFQCSEKLRGNYHQEFYDGYPIDSEW